MDNEQQLADPSDIVAPAAPVGESAPAEEYQAQLAALSAEKAELEDRLRRRQADFENFRRRAERERIENLEYAGMESVRALLPILDDFERALKLECQDREYAKGLELIYQRLFETLKKLGLEPITSAGEKFDPNRHHAIEMAQTDEAEDQTVLDEYQRGYNFRGRLLRPAMVKVAVRP